MIAHKYVANMLFLRLLRSCFYSWQDPKNAYEHLRISCDNCELVPNCIHKPTPEHIRLGVRAACGDCSANLYLYVIDVLLI